MRAIFSTLLLLALAHVRAQEPPLYTLEQIRAMTAEQVAAETPVRVRGVIVFHHAARFTTFIADDSAGIYIQLDPAALSEAERTPGTLLEVTGVASAGEFSVCVEGPRRSQVSVKVLGRTTVPAARPVTTRELTEPIHDASWVAVRGVIRSVSLAPTASDTVALLDYEVEGFALKIVLLHPRRITADDLPWHLVDRTVRVTGALGSLFNKQRQMTGRLLYVNAREQIVAESAPAAPTGSAPLRPITSLLRADRADAYSPVRVQGVVTLAQPGYGMFLRGEDGSLWVQTAQPIHAVPGSFIEAVGVPALATFRPMLKAAAVAELRREPAPEPERIAVARAMSGLSHGDFVSIEATLLKVQMQGANATLQLEESGQIFQARLDAPFDEGRLTALQRGSRLRLSGICFTTTLRTLEAVQSPDSFDILLRSERDLAVLSTPPWWTRRRALIALGLVAATAAGAFAWAAWLRRRVAALTTRVQREAIHSERLRIARDLHDDLGARITHLGALAALGEEDAQGSVELHRQFTGIRAHSREIVQALDATVWTVNPENNTLPELVSYLCEWAADFFQPSAIRCRFAVAENLPARPLDVELRHSLFLATKEALNNVARHARATEVWLRVAWHAPTLHLTIEDDGDGLPEVDGSAPHGLRNMRQRIEECGGRFATEPVAPHGTRLHFHLPIP